LKTMDGPFLIREPAPSEAVEVCDLVRRVFDAYVGPEYPPEGTAEFYAYANPQALAGRAGPGQVLLVAEQGGALCGMIETRGLSHVSLLFVDRPGQGIARALFERALAEGLARDPGMTRMTVNASSYAEPVYRKLGFEPTGPRQTRNGITFIPMAKVL